MLTRISINWIHQRHVNEDFNKLNSPASCSAAFQQEEIYSPSCVTIFRLCYAYVTALQSGIIVQQKMSTQEILAVNDPRRFQAKKNPLPYGRLYTSIWTESLLEYSIESTTGMTWRLLQLTEGNGESLMSNVPWGTGGSRSDCKAGVRRSIMLANFCGRGLVCRENRPMKSLNHDTRHLWRHDSDDKKMADDKYANASMLSAKQHKKQTVWVRRWLLICWSCICFKVNWSACFGV